MTTKHLLRLIIAVVSLFLLSSNTPKLKVYAEDSSLLQDLEKSLLYPLEEAENTLPASEKFPVEKPKANSELFYPNLFINDEKTPPATPTNNVITPPKTTTNNVQINPSTTTENLAPTVNTPSAAPATTTVTVPVQTTPPTNTETTTPSVTAPTSTTASTPSTAPSTETIKTPENSNVPSVLNDKKAVPPKVDEAAANKKGVLINFNNVAVTEYIRFISRLSNKNFVFDENDLQFNVTIVSEEPTSIDNIMMALLQELRIHDLELIEQGNTLLIHRNPKVAGISKVVSETNDGDFGNAEIITKVFRLNTLEATRAGVILKPLISASALVEVIKETNNIIVTDIASNVREISNLLKTLDSPEGGLIIGQYVAINQPPEVLITLARQLITPIAKDQKVTFISHGLANSIFIVSNPYLVERTLAILKYLDQSSSATQILDPRDLNFPGRGNGRWILDENGNWRFIPGSELDKNKVPTGSWKVDENGNWIFEPGDANGEGGPKGRWVKDKDGNWVFQLDAGQGIGPQKTQKISKNNSELPVGHIERTQFSIYKLQYRKGLQIVQALARIAESLASAGNRTNIDLLQAINSVQWIESSNSLIFTGTPNAVAKVKELIAEVDAPLRQVLLEMLILETDITDSLNFSTNVAANFGGGNVSGAEGFFSGVSTLPAGMATSGVGLTPNAGPQATNLTGFVLGIIGQTITHNGTEYASLGGLVKALTSRSSTKIVMNPKILTEDNSPAEIFVGLNTQFPTQSIANNFGTTITQNFEFRDVGTTLKVTPIINNNDVITLQIQEEVSSIVSGGVQTGITTTVIGPTTKINRTTTKVHVPNGFFLILSGMLSDQAERNRTQVPCLGSIPILGGAFSDKQIKDTKQNVMIFVHPIIIDTDEEMDEYTRRNQNMYRYKNRRPDTWVWETDEAMDFFNIIDEDNWDGNEDCY